MNREAAARADVFGFYGMVYVPICATLCVVVVQDCFFHCLVLFRRLFRGDVGVLEHASFPVNTYFDILSGRQKIGL